MTLKQLLVEPLLKMQADVYRETGTRPILTIDVHGVLFGELLKELVADGACQDGETLHVGADITIRSYAAARSEKKSKK